jgi:hypothetical protein
VYALRQGQSTNLEQGGWTTATNAGDCAADFLQIEAKAAKQGRRRFNEWL